MNYNATPQNLYIIHFFVNTFLCQPIGESIILFASAISEIINGNSFGDYYISDDRDVVFLELEVPDDYHDNGVIEINI